MSRPYLVSAVLLFGVSSLVGCSSSTTDSTVSTSTKPVAAATRKTVKTASDPDAGLIQSTPKDTTIEEILTQKVPAGDLAGRTGDFEKQTWRVKATLKSVELKKDGDYYLVMNGENGGQTVVEVPDPKLCQDSRFKDEITAARKAIEGKYHPTKTPQVINDPATVTGVGFLGWGSKGKKGAKGHSGPRLMPGTGIEFGG